MDNKKDSTIKLRISETLRKDIEYQSHLKRISMSEYIRKVLEDYISKIPEK